MNETPNEPIYLKKSATFYKIYGGLFLFSLIMSLLGLALEFEHNTIFNLVVGLPNIPLFIMAPTGLYYSWKSYKRKEGLPRTRFLYFMGHLFFCLFIIYCISGVMEDLSRMLG